jgi:hypothetical protein
MENLSIINDNINNIIYYGYYGSYLYGTNTPSSDIDCKGVYIPSFKEVILNKYQDVKRINIDNYDIELYSLQKFIKLSLEGQTSSFDMLYTPIDKYLHTDNYIWSYIVDNRDKFKSKRLKRFISYARNQAFHYSDKNDRMYVLDKILNILNSSNDDEIILNNYFKILDKDSKDYDIISKYCTIIVNGDKVHQKFLKIMDIEIQLNTEIRYVKETIRKKLDKYGKRVSNSLGKLDLKAMSHAYRISIALKHLVEDGYYNYPLPETNIIMDIKLGILDNSYIINLVENIIDEVVELIDKSDLPLEPDVDFWNDYLVDLYRYKDL